MDTHIHKVADLIQYVGPADGDLLPGATGRIVGVGGRNIVVEVGTRRLIIKADDERFRKTPTDEPE